MSKCPYCYRNGVWQKDPIILPNGAKYKWSDSEETILESVPNIEDRIYKGIYQVSEPEVQEIQDALKTLEEENLAIEDRTTFSPLNTSGKFQITGIHIKEMRDSVEKLIVAIGLTKSDFFNYDEDGNHITHPLGDKIEWTDPITLATDLQKFQVKYVHIEDLRHFISIAIFFRETWEDSIISQYFINTFFAGQDSKSWNFKTTSNSSSTSYLEITSIKDAYLYLVPKVANGGFPALYTQYYNNLYNQYKILSTAKLYFDINLINIPTSFAGFAENSYDVFYITIKVRTFFSPVVEFTIIYAYNYDPIHFVGMGSNALLKGTISIGSHTENLYTELVAMYPSFIDYYNGIIDTSGTYLTFFFFGMGCTGIVDLSPHEVKIDNIKVQ